MKVRESIKFPVKVRIKWAAETATISNDYNALNQSGVLVPLRPPFDDCCES